MKPKSTGIKTASAYRDKGRWAELHQLLCSPDEKQRAQGEELLWSLTPEDFADYLERRGWHQVKQSTTIRFLALIRFDDDTEIVREIRIPWLELELAREPNRLLWQRVRQVEAEMKAALADRLLPGWR